MLTKCKHKAAARKATEVQRRMIWIGHERVSWLPWYILSHWHPKQWA
jgi:hypothetical protein